MAKRIAITENIRAMIKASVGEDIDYDQVAIFEATAASTRPVNQRSTVYHDSVMTVGFLNQMAAKLPSESVTLQVMHETSFLPVGRVFNAEVYPAELGHHELNILFYVDADSVHTKEIELAIVDEVSVGALPKHAYCSHCNFDFMSDWYAMYDRECENGHEIGVDGCHLRLTDLDTWKETSLVNKGASSNAKILTSAKQRLGKDEVRRLAACGDQSHRLYLFAANSNPEIKKINPEVNIMDKEMLQLSSDNGRLAAEKAMLDAQIQLADKTNVDLSAKLEAAETELMTLKASDLAGQVDTLKVEAKTASEALTAAATAILPQYKLACTAANLQFKENATVAEMCETISTAGVTLAAVPRSQQTKDDGTDVNNTPDINLDDRRAANSAYVVS